MFDLEDQFGRKFPYLRLSITEACNFRCQYCLPNGFEKPCDMNYLSRAEIKNLVNAFAQLGTNKIRLTGGEPSTRNDLSQIIKDIRGNDLIKTIALTTNGYNLEKREQDFIDAGLDAINISIDSLNPSRFKEITGHDKLESILRAMFEIIGSKKIKVKTNSVLLKGLNDDEIGKHLNFIRDNDVSMRFIELMRTGDNKDFFEKHHLSSRILIDDLINYGFKESPRNINQGPAIEYSHPDYKGNIGIIAPYSKDFCASCNRLRVSARGELKLCLFGEGGINLRPYLQNANQIEELKSKILSALKFKTSGHDLINGFTGSTKHLAQIGG